MSQEKERKGMQIAKKEFKVPLFAMIWLYT
jgi:hypothetical protein